MSLQDEKSICYNCECEVGQEELMEGSDGEFYCEDCFNEMFIYCERCGDIESIDDAFYYEPEGYYCNSCFEWNFTECDSCGEHHLTSDMYSDDNGTYICEDCKEEYYYCDDCGNLIHENYINYCENDGCHYCEDCINDHNTGIINDYNYKPNPIFYGNNSNNLYMGIELEIDGAGEDPDNAEEILSEGNYNNDNIYIKHDSSLSDGFEIVSHPCTYDYHYNSLPWEDISKKAISQGYESHNSGTCGLHIHISREFFGITEQEEDLNISKLLYLTEKFWNNIVTFSRRTESQLDRWASRYGLLEGEKPIEFLEKCKGSGRYYALNLENNHTIEFRMFRGTLNINTFYATLQFTKHICEYAKNTNINKIQGITWDMFTNTIPEEYKELISYLQKRELIAA